MNSNKNFICIALIILLSVIWLFKDSHNEMENTPEDIKIALREVGHKILLANNDSLSLVLPVQQLDDTKYKQTFESEISIHPDSLVTIFKKSFRSSDLPRRYIVEVIQCTDNEIAYSYKMRNEKDKSIIPCGSRILPKGCYAIETQFLNKDVYLLNWKTLLLIIGLIVSYMIWGIFKHNKSSTNSSSEKNEQQITLGDYTFYPDQSKLSFKRKDIQLSKKEGELLSVLASDLNQVVKREDLIRKVWEDNGVIVGRSLDTYISKLRKRLKDDSSIKLANIHGIGYKLEVT